MKKLVVMLSGLLLLCGCGGNPAAIITIALSPSAQVTLDQGQTLNFTVTMTNDKSSQGVTWSMSGTSCSGTACGTFSSKTAMATTYNAPSSVSASMTVKVTATSVADSSKSASASILVTPAPSITTTSLTGGTAGTAYNVTLQASGGAGTLTWSLASGSTLPAGLSLSSAGVISGTPTTPGTTTFTVKVTDSSGAQGGSASSTQPLTLTIKPMVLAITTTALPNGVVGVAYAAPVAATGGTGTISWSVSTGSLPGGLTLTGANISGTPSAAGSATFTLTAKDSGTPQQTATQSLSITINAKLAITTTSLPNGVVNTAYSASLESSGGVGTVTWSVASGSLPAGLTLSGAGAIAGTPSTAGSSSFTVLAKDSGTPQQSVQQALSITIYSGLTITTTSLPNGIVNAAYSTTLKSAGGTGTITWSVSQGSLPAGLSLSNSGTISGTPTAAGTTNFTVSATDSSTPPQTKTEALSITINLVLSITTTSLPNGLTGTAYSQTLQSTGGSGTITWSVTTGSLPAGLSLSTAGAITGTPTTAGSSSFTVTAKDSGTPQQSVQQALSITIYTGLAITTTTLPNGVVNAAYSTTLASAGGTGTITWSVSKGSLPAGLTLSGSGTISGTPTATGTSSFTVSATDSSTPPQTKTQALSITVNAVLSITTTSLPSGLTGTAYSETLQSTGGSGTITWSVSTGSLPAGLSLSTAGAITGTPTTAGSSNFTVTAKDSGTPQQSVQQALSITIYAALTIATSTLPGGIVNVAYSATLQSSGGTGTITWSVSQGSLPAGLTLSTSGKISGTPTATGKASFTVSATDSGTPPQTKTQALSITINQPLSITTTSLPGGTVATAYSQNIQTSGGTLPVTWSVSTGSLPAGLALTNGANGVGVISGTPTAYGSSTFTVTATDSSTPAQSAQQQFTIVISNVGLSITTTSLPNATAGVAYSAPLDASGGTPPYTWTVATGSALPPWLTLSGSDTSWKLSGTPSAAGVWNFSLTVTDSSTPTPQSQTVALSVTITGSSTACGTGNEKILHGQYAFTLTGFNSSGFQAAIGSFTADGEGHITAGMVDANGVSPGVNSGSVTASGSSYSVGSDGRGCATIETPFYTYTTRFALGATSSVASTGTVQEWESGASPYIASGRLLLQSVPNALPSGTYVLQETGIYDVTHQYWAGGIGAGSGSGGQFTSGEYDLNVEGHHFSYTGVTGGYSNLDPTTGRVTTTITLNGVTSHGVHYLVSSKYFTSITTDALATDTFVATGTGQVQDTSFTLTNGQNLVFYATGLKNVEFAVVTITGSGSLSANVYHDIAGTWTSPSPSTATCAYTIDTLGRVATSGADCGEYFDGTSWKFPPVFYLTGNNTGVMLSTDDPGVLLGQLVPQSATSITAGDYYAGTQAVTSQSVNETLTGVGTITSSGGLTGDGDSTSVASPQQGNQSLSITLTVNPDGTFSNSNHPGLITGVVISGSQLIQVDGQGSSFPSLLLINTVPES